MIITGQWLHPVKAAMPREEGETTLFEIWWHLSLKQQTSHYSQFLWLAPLTSAVTVHQPDQGKSHTISCHFIHTPALWKQTHTTLTITVLLWARPLSIKSRQTVKISPFLDIWSFFIKSVQHALCMMFVCIVSSCSLKCQLSSFWLNKHCIW